MKDKLDVFIDSVEHLPPSPRLLVKLHDVFKQPDKDINEVVSLIGHDPSFTAKVLQRCNSAYFGGDQPAANISEAVARLGFEELYRIVLAMFAVTALVQPGAAGGRQVELLWRHSMAVAVGASILARDGEQPNPTAFTAGLLHEVGKVVMVSAASGKYTQAVLDAGQFKQPVILSEKKLFGFDHTEVGAHLLKRWNLPPEVVGPVRHHHDLAGSEPYERLSAAVYVANIMAHATGENMSGQWKGLPDNSPALGQLQLTLDDIAKLMPAMQAGIEKAKSLAPA